MRINPKLIFDLGAHLGLDTAYYLECGYKVVAVEPVPEFAKRISKRFAYRHPKFGAVTVVQAAITTEGEPTTLYLSASRLGETHSILPERVRACCYDTVEAKGITLPVLMLGCGAIPHYIKIDIEGADVLPLRQLAPTYIRPAYISIELHHDYHEDALEIFFLLHSMGYHTGQLVNQVRVREGEYGMRFVGGGMSGPFGDLLPKDKWKSLSQCAIEWFSKPDHAKDECWYDLHVRHS